jgi:hypothetical protein
MLYCQASKKLSKPNEGSRKLVTHVRNKTYYRWNRKSGQEEIDGHGWEVVREILVSQEYYNQALAAGFKPEVVKEKES